MKKKYIKLAITLFICICAILLLAFFIYKFTIYINTKTLFGKIIHIENGTFTIITETDCIYTFNIPKNFSPNINENVEIKYLNELSFFNVIQNVNIIKIKTKDDFTFAHNGIFQDYYNKAFKIVNSMNIDEIIGQLFLADVPSENSITPTHNYPIGGYVFFENNIESVTKDTLSQNIASYQENSKIPLLMAIDEEGGKISRLNKNSSIVPEPFLSSQELYSNGGFEEIAKDTITKSNLLYELGFNVNLAPVADIATNSDSYMYPRSFGKNAELTSKYIETVISNTDYKVSYVLKHFPGYGDGLDTHLQEAIDERDYNSFVENDFLPFQAGIDNGAQAILVSHNSVVNIDKVNPASLSPNILNILKNKLKFSGVIITDNLEMSALSSANNKYIRALLAGNNIIIVTEHTQACDEILSAIKNNIISEEYIKHLVTKNIAWKCYKQLI